MEAHVSQKEKHMMNALILKKPKHSHYMVNHNYEIIVGIIMS